MAGLSTKQEGRTVRAIAIAVQSEYANGTLKTHTLFGDTDNPFVIVAERNPFHGGRELPHVQTLAVGYVPQA